MNFDPANMKLVRKSFIDSLFARFTFQFRSTKTVILILYSEALSGLHSYCQTDIRDSWHSYYFFVKFFYAPVTIVRGN